MTPIERLAAALTCCALLGACGTTGFAVGSNFDLDAFASHVQRGATTQDQVQAWLGSPSATGVSVETSGQQYVQWTYYFAEGALSSLSTTKLKTLQVKLDKQGIVQGYELSTSSK